MRLVPVVMLSLQALLCFGCRTPAGAAQLAGSAADAALTNNMLCVDDQLSPTFAKAEAIDQKTYTFTSLKGRKLATATSDIFQLGAKRLLVSDPQHDDLGASLLAEHCPANVSSGLYVRMLALKPAGNPEQGFLKSRCFVCENISSTSQIVESSGGEGTCQSEAKKQALGLVQDANDSDAVAIDSIRLTKKASVASGESTVYYEVYSVKATAGGEATKTQVVMRAQSGASSPSSEFLATQCQIVVNKTASEAGSSLEPPQGSSISKPNATAAELLKKGFRCKSRSGVKYEFDVAFKRAADGTFIGDVKQLEWEAWRPDFTSTLYEQEISVSESQTTKHYTLQSDDDQQALTWTDLPTSDRAVFGRHAFTIPFDQNLDSNPSQTDRGITCYAN